MKTLKQNILKAILVLTISTVSIVSNARTSGEGIVPAKATSFTAVLNSSNNNKVELKWSTESETDLSHFIVERSTDGITFSDAALVFAYGNTTAKSDYAFADNISKLKSTTVHYRITSISGDGKTQCSDIRIIKTK